MKSINKKRFMGPLCLLIGAALFYFGLVIPSLGLIGISSIFVGSGVGLTGYYFEDAVVSWFDRDGWK